MYSSSTRSAIRGAAITTNVEFPLCTALVADAYVTVTLYWGNGTSTANFPLQKGYNPVQVKKVTFGSGTIIAINN